MGALLVGMFGVIQEPNHSLDDLVELYKKPAFIAYFSILETCIFVTMVVTHYLENVYERIQNPDDKLFAWIDAPRLKTYIGVRQEKREKKETVPSC